MGGPGNAECFNRPSAVSGYQEHNILFQKRVPAVDEVQPVVRALGLQCPDKTHAGPLVDHLLQADNVGGVLDDDVYVVYGISSHKDLHHYFSDDIKQLQQVHKEAQIITSILLKNIKSAIIKFNEDLNNKNLIMNVEVNPDFFKDRNT